MNRRAFIGGLLASAAVRTWPFRVFSFPSEIVVPNIGGFVPMNYHWTIESPPAFTIQMIRTMREQLLSLPVNPLFADKFLTIL